VCNTDAEVNVYYGPALIEVEQGSVLSSDMVYLYVVGCDHRKTLIGQYDTYRNYNWPDSATADGVNNVMSECDMVRVLHRQCGQDKWTKKFILTSRICTDNQLDASATNSLSYVTRFHEDRAIDTVLTTLKQAN